jgi:2'-hydroxyisoflavone reductase
MTPTRREFLETMGALGAGLALGGAAACGPDAGDGAVDGTTAASPKRILIFGGTGFIGPHTVRHAVARGHEVSIFTRGRSDADIPDVEHLIGDRNDDHTALEGRTWDVVLDNNAQDYRWVQQSTALLADAVDHYLLVSSISAYQLEPGRWSDPTRVLTERVIDEGYPCIEPPEGWEDGDDAPYGLMKSLSEDIVRQAFPGRATIVRPGLIVGPGDPTDRFTYWPVRLDEGGEVLAPGNPEHSAQVIDQRDLTEWIVRLAEGRVTGDFNATGPAERMTMASMLAQAGEAARNPYELTWVEEPFLREEGLRAWSDLPAWMPGSPLMFVNVSRANEAGLTYRPLPLTARDTLAWDETRPADERENRQAGLDREREREVLALWHASRS